MHAVLALLSNIFQDHADGFTAQKAIRMQLVDWSQHSKTLVGGQHVNLKLRLHSMQVRFTAMLLT